MGSWKSVSSRFGWLVALGVIGLAGVAESVQAQTPMEIMQNSPSFRAEIPHSNFGNGESVNIANGGLTVVHPAAISLPENMGGMLRPVRVYSSKNQESALSGNTLLGSQPKDEPYGIMGMEWTLTAGRVFMRVKVSRLPNSTTTLRRAQYYYLDESGVEHRLYRKQNLEPEYVNLHVPPSNIDGYYTNDGSYIRAQYALTLTDPNDYPNTVSGTWSIFLPDG